MITKDHVHEEARKRILDMVGGHRGGDLALKTLQVVIRHCVSPAPNTRSQLHGVLQLIACCNRLEKSLPDDFAAERHWRVDMAVYPALSAVEDPRVARLEAVVQSLAQRLEDQAPRTYTQLQVVPSTAMVTSPAVTVLTPVEQPTAGPDLQAIEMESLATIAAAAEAARARMPRKSGMALVQSAAERAAQMRTAKTPYEIRAMRDDVLAFIETEARQ